MTNCTDVQIFISVLYFLNANCVTVLVKTNKYKNNYFNFTGPLIPEQRFQTNQINDVMLCFFNATSSISQNKIVTIQTKSIKYMTTFLLKEGMVLTQLIVGLRIQNLTNYIFDRKK